ncbi:MAG: SgcJ/EcaC family oxidoreductase [Phycisphaeraceae bacterium]|nr:SgcJ/EcaC family oxidoreductase [Phycisphaeraceae bacterium]
MNLSRAVSVVSIVATFGMGVSALAADPDPRQAELTKVASTFVEAFQNGDAKAIAALWTPDADFIDVEGRVLRGRDAIEKDFAELFSENKGLKVRIEVASVKFVGPEMAIEDGTTSVLAPDGSLPSRAHYTNVLVKKDGKWLLSSVREAPYVPPSNQEFLHPLDWTIGEWADTASEGHEARAVFEWSPDRNFIISLRAVRVNDTFLDNGTQRIGWDPAAKQIRLWNFEPDGGFGEGTWTPQPDGSWIVKTNSVLQSGQKASATTVVTRVDPDTVTWQSKDQTLDGKPMPDSPVVTMKRVN